MRVQGFLSVAAAQSLGGAQPQPWLFVALLLSHLFYLACWAYWIFIKQGLSYFLILVLAQPVVGLFFGGAGIYCVFCAAIATECVLACFRREHQLQMKRNRRRLQAAGVAAAAAAAAPATFAGEQQQQQQQLRRRVILDARPTE